MIKSPLRILTNLLTNKGLEYFNKYYGVYYGFVLQNEDPKNLGRLYVYIPEVNGPYEKGIWAYPFGIYGGDGYGMNLTPNIHDKVYIMYRFGNPQFPVWAYAGYSLVPKESPVSPNTSEKQSNKPEEFPTVSDQGIKFPNGILIKISGTSDDPSFDIYHPSNQVIKLTKDQIVIKYKGEDRINITEDEITFNDGSNGGLINISSLVDKLNQLINSFNTHSHEVAGANTKTPTAPATPVNESEIVDNKVTH